MRIQCVGMGIDRNVKNNASFGKIAYDVGIDEGLQYLPRRIIGADLADFFGYNKWG